MRRDWESYIDRAIRQAIGDGKMDNKPGHGQPLRLDDDRHTPPELRMAHKILKDNELLPDWVMLAGELNSRRDQLTGRVEKAAHQYQTRAAAAMPGGDSYRVDLAWKTTQTALREAAEQVQQSGTRL